MKTLRLALAPLLAVASFHALAQDLRPGGVFIEGGATAHQAYAVTAGVTWPWNWKRTSASGVWTGFTELYVSEWEARGVTKRQSFTQVGLIPIFRYRFDHGHSRWFFEGGIGLSATDRLYVTPDKRFSTRFNFVDVLSFGRSMGDDNRREISFRYAHVSNAGIRKPNPGEDFLQIRYAALF